MQFKHLNILNANTYSIKISKQKQNSAGVTIDWVAGTTARDVISDVGSALTSVTNVSRTLTTDPTLLAFNSLVFTALN